MNKSPSFDLTAILDRLTLPHRRRSQLVIIVARRVSRRWQDAQREHCKHNTP
jgi:hypothetical protein